MKPLKPSDIYILIVVLLAWFSFETLYGNLKCFKDHRIKKIYNVFVYVTRPLHLRFMNTNICPVQMADVVRCS